MLINRGYTTAAGAGAAINSRAAGAAGSSAGGAAERSWCCCAQLAHCCLPRAVTRPRAHDKCVYIGGRELIAQERPENYTSPPQRPSKGAAHVTPAV